MQRRAAILRTCREVRSDCSEWEVELEGASARAVAYHSLVGTLKPGDRVLLNTTAGALSLGTGGVHFVIARLESEDQEEAVPSFPGREAGHIMKLRYTPLQHRVRSVEEEGSPHRQALLRFRGLGSTPVLAAELHSQAAAAALAAKALAPELRIALVLLDTAALPLSFSRLASRLRADGTLHATVTVGQAFGGDYEAVNLYTGIIAARAVAHADVVLVTQGPGNVGTGTEFGFSGLALAEALHAAAALGGAPLLAARLSEADPRPRHRGVSHHLETLLCRCLRVGVDVPVRRTEDLDPIRTRLVEGYADHRIVARDPSPWMDALEPYRDILTTMGRGLDEDRLFFETAAAAGVYAAERARAVRSGEVE